MMKPTIILITGHPATGKTTLAHHLAQELCLPLIWKDQIKETLLNMLGLSTIKKHDVKQSVRDVESKTSRINVC